MMHNNNEGMFSMRDAKGGPPVPLKGISIAVDLEGILAHTVIEQRFANAGEETIEAVYSFPLPMAATLLGLEIDIDGKTLSGQVQAKKTAEANYEDAVATGNGAFLLRELDAGRFQINVGNLKPGEACCIRVRYGEFLQNVGDTIRFRLPTVIAPHYGNPSAAGIAPQDDAKVDLLAEYPFKLELRLLGSHARSELNSPTHPIDIDRTEGEARVRTRKGSFLDRDFVLTLKENTPALFETWMAPDQDAVAVMARIHPSPVERPDRKPRHLCVVIDCSGSMSGESIAQVRSALLSILDRLVDGDTLSIQRFGSTVDWMSRTPRKINVKQRSATAQWIGKIEADLGGTEIMTAIQSALDAAAEGTDLLLITDGEAHVSDEWVTQQAQRQRRIFTVGVGAAVSEKIVRILAEQSGGACELVTPGEDMSRVIVNQFLRMESERIDASIDWGSELLAELGTASPVFPGETTVRMALVRLAAGNHEQLATLNLGETRQGQTAQSRLQQAAGVFKDALPRLLAARRMPELSSEEAVALAVRHQLLTSQTAMVAVLVRARAEQTDGLPALVDVPQMLAAGWGGVGAVMQEVQARAYASKSGILRDNYALASNASDCDYDDYACFDAPSFMRPAPAPLVDFIALAQSLQDRWAAADSIPVASWQSFVDEFTDTAITQLLKQMDAISSFAGEDAEGFARVLAFVDVLLDSLDSSAKRHFRPLRRVLVRTRSAFAVPADLLNAVRTQFEFSGLPARKNWFQAIPDFLRRQAD